MLSGRCFVVRTGLFCLDRLVFVCPGVFFVVRTVLFSLSGLFLFVVRLCGKVGGGEGRREGGLG